MGGKAWRIYFAFDHDIKSLGDYLHIYGHTDIHDGVLPSLAELLDIVAKDSAIVKPVRFTMFQVVPIPRQKK